MALFTATPQLKSWEVGAARRDARRADHEHRMQLFRAVIAAYHTSCAKHYLAVNERMAFGIDDPNARRMSAEHGLAATAMIELFDNFVQLPMSGKTERAEREKLMRKLAGGINGASNALLMWRTLEPKWLAALAGGAA